MLFPIVDFSKIDTIRGYSGKAIILTLEIPVSRIFLGADAQLHGTSLAGVRKSFNPIIRRLISKPIYAGPCDNNTPLE